jgi:hypothetical protein
MALLEKPNTSSLLLKIKKRKYLLFSFTYRYVVFFTHSHFHHRILIFVGKARSLPKKGKPVMELHSKDWLLALPANI